MLPTRRGSVYETIERDRLEAQRAAREIGGGKASSPRCAASSRLSRWASRS